MPVYNKTGTSINFRYKGTGFMQSLSLHGITTETVPSIITEVNVTPAEVTAEPGTTHQFTAVVSGVNNPSLAVTWSVTGAASPYTAIDANGLLAIGADETAAALTVVATSVEDASKSGTATVAVDWPTLAGSTWAQIAAASEVGIASSVWQVGNEKDIQLTTGEVLTLQIYGFDHDDKADGGKAGITFGLKNLMATTRRVEATNTNANGFAGSEIYTWLTGALYDSLPSDLKSLIKSVNKKTSAGNQSSTINTNAMKIFLFSEVECFGTTTYSAAGEGSQYPIFTDNASRIKKLENGAGSANYWWERSPNTSGTTNFCSVTSGGGAYHFNYASSSRGVCFGFCV